MRNLIKKITPALLSLVFVLALLITAQPVSAQLVNQEPGPGTTDGPGGLTNPAIGTLGQNTGGQATSGGLFVRYFITLWSAFITVGGLAVILMFLWGALDWITAGGESSKVATARQKIINAIIGLIILVASFVIINFMGFLFFGDNFNILSPAIPDPADITNTTGGTKQPGNPGSIQDLFR